MLGTVKWYDNARGIGIIESETCPDLFINRTAVENSGRITLSRGMHVEFDVVKGKNGDQAINLHVLS